MSTDGAAPSTPTAPAALPAARPLYWSIRRELWENRSVYLAPLAVAALVLFAMSIHGTVRLPQRVRAAAANDRGGPQITAVTPYAVAPAPIMFTTILVGMFFCLDALYGERRDRSILFWKSLPVSDRTAVLAKAAVPFVILPAIGFALSVAVMSVLMALGTVVLVANGLRPTALWAQVGVVSEPLIMLYGLAVHVLWHAPIYGWFLLISAWARRTPFLWAVLPPLALAAAEHLAFQTSYVGAFLRYRLGGAMKEAFILEAGKTGNISRLSQLDLLGFLATPGLWIGLIAAAAFLVAAARLRRNREPI
jgi:ABC-2 type transport system permease protein